MKFKKKLNNGNKIKTRKELRKEKRKEKKQKKNDYFSNRKLLKSQTGKNAKTQPKDSENVGEKGKKKVGKMSKKEHAKEEVNACSLLDQQRNREKQKEKNIQMNSKTSRSKQLLKANEAEDREIRKMEKLLNLNKRKSKNIPSSFVSDGLDYLLELCDAQKRQEISEYEAQTHLSDSENDFEDDLAEVTGKKNVKKLKTKDMKVDEDEESENNDTCDDEVDDDFDELNEEYNGEDNEGFGSDLSSDNEEFLSDLNSHNEEVQSENGDENEHDEAFDEDMETIENPFSDDDSVDEDDFDDVDKSDTDVDGEDEKTLKRKSITTNTNERKKVKFADGNSETSTAVKSRGKLCKEERMKQLMGFVENEKRGTQKLKQNSTQNLKLKKDSKVKKQTETPSSKAERMKRLMGFVESESKEDEEKSKEISKKEKMSKEDRMKQLLGFVNDEERRESETDEGDKEEGDGTWEDIYGRKRDKDGNIIQEKSTKYVPPHLRHTAPASNKESLALLKRQMKGLLNRLTENNIKSISTGLESMYTENSRHDTNATLLILLRESLLTQTLTPDKMMLEHALLITVLHANIGTEIGACLLQSLIQDWDLLHKRPEAHNVDNKQLDNYLSLLAGLYQFKLLTHTIVYDLLEVLIDTFDEKATELILVLLKTVGLSLRKDNAVRFKSCLLSIQAKASAHSDLKEKPRTKFMLDILLSVKNNNVHKIPGYDVSTVQRMRANLKLLIRASCYVSELNICLQDLLRADEKGRWWIVGSAWSGKEATDSAPRPSLASVPQFSVEILELARRQRMNTDVRRNVFCVLMSSEDYLDAYEKLLKLGVRNEQTDEIVNVIVHCLLNEKQYNPYYTHLTNHFISSNRRFRMLVQYTVWDKFKLLNEMKPNQIVNLAKFLSSLFLLQALPITVLKVLEFTELTKPHVRLLRQVFLALLLQDDEALRLVFGKITKSSELWLLREGLHLFLMTFVMKKLPEDEEGQRMRRNAGVVTDILAPR